MIPRIRIAWLSLAAGLFAVSLLAADLPRAKPEAVGLSSERLARVSAALQAGVKRGDMPGYVALVARRGKVAFHEAHGVLDPATGKPMTKDAIFRIYSMTKPITSAAVMMLAEEGKLKLSDPIGLYLPELANLKVATNAHEAASAAEIETAPAARPITVFDLLRHTSGLTYGFFKPFPGNTPLEQMYLDGGVNDLEISNAELVTRISKLPLKYEPGTTWWYSRSTDVLGRLVEVVSGMTLGEFFQARIFAPLKMNDSAFPVAAGKAGRLAQPFPADREGRILLYTDPLEPVTFEAGGQGLTSTVMDYATFLHMMLGGGQWNGTRLLGRKTVELMTTDQVGDVIDKGRLFLPGVSHGFGLGFAVRNAGPRGVGALNPVDGSEGEYFWAGYAGTFFWVDPSEELIAVYMMQSIQHLVPYSNTFKTMVLQAVVD